MKRLFISILFSISCICIYAQSHHLSGTVINKSTDEPVEFATIVLENTSQWAVADENGKFTINNIQAGKNKISISCLGFVTDTREVTISRDIDNYKVHLMEDNLTLESVVVSAKENKNSATTSRTIDRTALDHIQMVNVYDVSGLLPGGTTQNPDLLKSQTFDIRGGGVSELGNSSFGTAVEVDGVRLSNNSSFSGIKGAAVNNIASTNVESIEVITGVPSVEYGDMTSGVVKINTNRGRTPYVVTFTTNPNLKQVSANKGFGLGRTRKGQSNGVLNASVEYAKAIDDPRSPYTSYDRKQLSFTYNNTFNRGALSDTPLRLTVGIAGNLGGMDEKDDPDTFGETRIINRDNSVRGNISLDWLLSKKWITNLEFNGSVVYSNKHVYEHKNKDFAAPSPAIHGREEGYFVATDYDEDPNAAVILRPSGYFYETMCVDDRPLSYKLSLKGNWTRQFGKVNNKLKVGAEWSGDGNLGIGQYTENMRTAPDFWEYRYCDQPFMNTVSAYIEDNITIPVGETQLNLIPGIRNDNRIIKGSAYGTASGFSPRFNMKWTIFSARNRLKNTLKDLSFRASWGIASKLPSFSVLFPVPTYNREDTFRPTSSSDGAAYYAYYILPKVIEYNPDLRWQRNQQAEIGMDMNIDGYKISLAGFFNRTHDSYRLSYGYDRFDYNYTDYKNLDACTIPADNRSFSVDRSTGIVTVHDKTGVLPDEVLNYRTRSKYSTRTYSSNDIEPVTRYGVEWIVDFKKIRAINTSIRLDGTFYGYKGLNYNTLAYTSASLMGSDGESFKYVGYYLGDKTINNGNESRTIRNNLTITTHIPKVRMIISLRLESTLMNYRRALSQRPDGSERAVALSDKSDLLSANGQSIYDGDVYTVYYPEYYTSIDDPTTRRNFLKDITWAKGNDQKLYNDLSRLIITQINLSNTFKKDYISPYFAMNFRVTKEIGDIASVSFYANNFFISNMRVYSTKTGQYSSSSSMVANFYYGLSLKLKF